VLKTWIATRLRYLADRIDYAGAPKAMSGYSFTFENRRGIVFREDGKGCPLWYYGEADYQRAHAEADTDHAIVDWTAGTARLGR
jgi:hypothetical protein